jgi:hypothetical protein
MIIGSVTLVVLLGVLASGSKQRPPDWAITLVEWRLKRQMKRACEQKAEYDRIVEEQEADKIENQLL